MKTLEELSKAKTINITRGVPKVVEKGWGEEYHIVNNKNNNYCGKVLRFTKKGAKFSMHYHGIKHETFLVLSGIFRIRYFDHKTAKELSDHLLAYDVVTIPQHCSHQLECLSLDENAQEALIIEFSTPDYIEDSYRVSKGDSQK